MTGAACTRWHRAALLGWVFGACTAAAQPVSETAAAPAVASVQRSAARALLQAPLSVRSLAQVDEVMALQAVLRVLEAGSSLRVPQNHAVAAWSAHWRSS